MRKKHHFKFATSFLGLLIVGLAASWLCAEDAGTVDDCLIYSRENELSRGALSDFFQRLSKSEASNGIESTLNVRVSLKPERKQYVYEAQEFTPQPVRKLPGNGYSFLPLAFPSPVPTVDLSGYDELWLDYDDFGSTNSVLPGVNISISANDFYGKGPVPVSLVSSRNFPVTALEINVANAKWLPKRRVYTLARLFRRPPDDNWHYLGLGNFTVVQRRLHQNLVDIEALYVMVAHGVEIENVNFYITDKDNYSQGQLVQLGKLHPTRQPGYANQVYRINIPEITASYFPHKKTFLQEIMVFVKGDAREISDGGRPVRKLVFQRLKAEYSRSLPENVGAKAAEVLPVNIVQVGADTTRMILDLSPLRKWQEAYFKQGSVVVNGGAGNPKRIIRKIRLVSYKNENVPAFLHIGADLVRAWGGPYKYTDDQDGTIEWPKIIAYLPLEKYTAHSRGAFTRKGVVIRSDKPFLIASNNDTLTVDGFGAGVRLELPVIAEVKGEAILYLAADYDERIKSIVAKVTLSSGETLLLPVEPYRSVRIPAKGQVRRLELLVKAFKSPFHINISDAVLFQPKMLTERQAFFTKLPVHGEMRSVADELRSWHELAVSRHAEGAFNSNSEENILSGPLLLKASRSSIGTISTVADSPASSESPWFRVDSVTLASGRGLKEDACTKIMGLVSPEPFFVRLAKKTLLVLMVWLLWRKLHSRVELLAVCFYNLLGKYIPFSVRTPKALSLFYGLIASILYVAGIVKRVTEGENYYFTFGALAAVLFMRCSLGLFRPYLTKFAPSVADVLFSSRATPFFACAMAGLFAIAAMLSLKLMPVAEQLAIMVYYALVLGVVFEAIALYKNKSQRRETPQ